MADRDVDANLGLLAGYLGKADAAIGCLAVLCGAHPDLARMTEAVAVARDNLKGYARARREADSAEREGRENG